ncbi:MAG: hypothetical protein KDC38_20175 [Planctomycetes bacterium]|nr:hypothetical protein [Planctomycetota bacterium]
MQVPAPSSVAACGDATDTHDDGLLDISDAVYALASLFIVAADPPPASGSTCGEDPTPVTVDCVE